MRLPIWSNKPDIRVSSQFWTKMCYIEIRRSVQQPRRWHYVTGGQISFWQILDAVQRILQRKTLVINLENSV